MAIIGNYTLELYCENYSDLDELNTINKDNGEDHEYKEFPHEFISNNSGSTARRLARKAGWKLDLKNGLAFCPKCVKKGDIS